MAAGVGSTEANPFVLCGLRRWPLSRRSRRPLWTGKRAFFYFVWEFVCHTLGRCMPVAAMLTHVAIVWMGASVPGKGPSLYARDAAQKPHWLPGIMTRVVAGPADEVFSTPAAVTAAYR